jgi:hypothetical protein
MSTANTLTGYMTYYADQGVDAVVPAFHDESKTGWDGFTTFDDGDLLTVFNDAARTSVMWQGVIEMDFTVNTKPNPVYAAVGQHVMTQHAPPFQTMRGIPKGIAPAQWGRMLIDEKPATLVKVLKP